MTYSEIKSLLMSIEDPVLKLETLMDLGKTLSPIPNGAIGTEIKGCASRVEIYRDTDGNLFATADSALVRGIIAILLAMKTENADLGDFASLDLNLGATRMTGTASMIEYLKSL